MKHQAAKALAKDDIGILAAHLAKLGMVFVPASDTGGTLAFREYSEGMEVDLSRRTDLSAREILQPMTRYFMTFENGPRPSIKFTEGDYEQRFIVGMRGCDSSALNVLDRVFSESDEYRKMRDRTAVIGLLCDHRDPGCFCEAVGSNPHDTAGMDLAMYPAGGQLLIKAITESGSEILEGLPFDWTDDVPDPELADSPPAPEEIPEGLDALLKGVEDQVWEKIAFPCVNCRVCTYVCPTCHCFTITDETLGEKGARATVWDSCQSSGFTREASGHNPRESGADRARQRIMHKFSYFPDAEGRMMCTGCGRCISSCPTGRSILDEVLALAKEVV